MDSTRSFVFFLFLCIFAICRTQSYNFDACSTSENDLLNVTFGSLDIKCNTKYDLKLVSSSPQIRFLHADKDKFYEVLMIDPDAPSAENPKCRCWLHMLLSNVKGGDLQNGISATGSTTVLQEFNPPTPPKGVGYHRYILAAFGHAEPLKKPKEKIATRCGFDIDLFTKLHNLHPSPDASNMFRTITE